MVRRAVICTSRNVSFASSTSYEVELHMIVDPFGTTPKVKVNRPGNYLVHVGWKDCTYHGIGRDKTSDTHVKKYIKIHLITYTMEEEIKSEQNRTCTNYKSFETKLGRREP